MGDCLEYGEVVRLPCMVNCNCTSVCAYVAMRKVHAQQDFARKGCLLVAIELRVGLLLEMQVVCSCVPLVSAAA